MKVEKATKVIGAKVTDSLYETLLAEAKETGKSISDYLRQVVDDRHKCDQLLTDIEAIIERSNVEQSASISVKLGQELKHYRDDLRAQYAVIGTLRKGQDAHDKTLVTFEYKLDTIIKGIGKLLTAGGQ